MRWPWQRGEDESDIVRTATSERDERLSEYLDGFLGRPERAAVEADAERDTDVRVALEGMRAVRAGLGGLGLNRAPRSFALDLAAAPSSYGLPRIELYARLGAVAAALALSVIGLVPTFTGGAFERQEAVATSAELRATSPQAAQDAAALADTLKQAAESTASARAAAPAAPIPGGPAPASAPATGGATGAGASAAPQLAPAGAAPPAAPAPVAPESFGATSNAAVPGTPEVAPQTTGATQAGDALPPVELRRADGSSYALWITQVALALAALLLAGVAVVLMLRRRAALG